METQLAEFVGDFLIREEKEEAEEEEAAKQEGNNNNAKPKEKKEGEEEGNHWIVKPWNMGRGIDISISNHLRCLIRLAETGPRVVSKCILSGLYTRYLSIRFSPLSLNSL